MTQPKKKEEKKALKQMIINNQKPYKFQKPA